MCMLKVRAYDKDGIGIFSLIDPDDLMGISFSEPDGSFKLDGCGDDFNILPGVENLPEPYLTIKHYCNSEKGETLRLPEFDTFVPETYDLGVMVLDDQHPSTTTTTSTRRPSVSMGGDEREERDRNRSMRPKPKERELEEEYNGDEEDEALDNIADVLVHKPDRQVREE